MGEACKCGFFKEMTCWTKVTTIVSLCSRGRGGLVRSTLLCGEKGQKRGRRRRGGVLVEGGGEVEHVPDCEWPFGGRWLWLRLASGTAFQRYRPDRPTGLAGVFLSFGVCRRGWGTGALWRLVCNFVWEGGGRVVGGGGGGRCWAVCDVL